MSVQGSVYAFIMAGGVGSRLWPRSRRHSPKQFLDLVRQETMLQDAYQRLLPIISAERILVGVGVEYVPMVREQLPDLPNENIVVEPAGRGTAPAIGLGAMYIHRQDPDAVMVVVTADHHSLRVSAMRIEGMPYCSKALVIKLFAPEHKATFSSRFILSMMFWYFSFAMLPRLCHLSMPC